MSDNDRQMNLDECQELFEKIGGTNNHVCLRRLFRKLLKRHPLLSYGYGEGPIFWRGRQCESEGGFSTLSEVTYPSAAIAETGRLNDRNQPMLYGASQILTVLNELSVRQGSFVHYIGFVVKPGNCVRLGVVGEQYHIFHTGLSPVLGKVPGDSIQKQWSKLRVEDLLSIVYVDAFLRTVLSDAYAVQREYAHTRALGKEILRKHKGIEGFFYPSTKHDVGMNLIVTPSCFDSKFKIITSSVLRVDKVRDFGMYDFHNCTSIRSVYNGVLEKTKAPHAYAARFFNVSKDELKNVQITLMRSETRDSSRGAL
jgi:hypothetical protein